MTGEDSEY